VLPEVEAPEGSGLGCWVVGGCGCFGLVPEVEGVGEECGEFVAGDVLEPELGGEPGGVGGAGGAMELCWQEWRVHSLCLDPEVEVLVLWSNCTGIQERYLLLQSRICRYQRFRKWSTIVVPQLLTVQKYFCH